MFIHLRGVRQNNLKNIDVDIPINSFTVVCGPSGSGKSSLAFETLFAEGQRRYIESLSSYAKQFLNQAPKPLLETIQNVPPAIALEQKNTIKNSRATVGTTSEIIEYLRLLYSKISKPQCPKGHGPVIQHSSTSVTDHLVQNWNGKRVYLCVELGSKRRFNGIVLFKTLIGEGFSKTLSRKRSGKKWTYEVHEISNSKGVPSVIKKKFMLVIDRLAVKKEDRGRLEDSVKQAYQTCLKYNEDPHPRLFVISTDHELKKFSDSLSCDQCDWSFPALSPQLFSFNSPLGACPSCKGFGNTLGLDVEKIIPNPNLSLDEGALLPFSMPSFSGVRKKLLSYCKKEKINIHLPWKKLPQKHKNILWKGNSKFPGVCGHFDQLEEKKYKMHVRVLLSRFKTAFTCPDCGGTRLKKLTQHMTLKDHSISDLCFMSLDHLHTFLKTLPMNSYEKKVSKEIYEQLCRRLEFLIALGVGYLSLGRPTRTLSGGEFQRLLLAKQLGMGLSQTLYVLDEPTIGLHPRDSRRLIEQLKDLNRLGNTLVIVEHDKEVISQSDYIIEMGPQSGHKGGSVVFKGTYGQFLKSKSSNTNRFLKEKSHPPHSPRPVNMKSYKHFLEITGCTENNLKRARVQIPLNRLVTVTGVSGSGKSSLITETLYPALKARLNMECGKVGQYKKLTGDQYIKNVVHIDQSPVTQSVRSNTVTYLKVYNIIRDIFAQTQEAQKVGFLPGAFSLNVDGGRCPTCKGLGYELIDMVFMDDIQSPCMSCGGKKFTKEVLDIKYRGRSIHEVLEMTVAEAMDFFISYPSIRKPLNALKHVGLDYLTLGQNTTTLSGGESQRIKIANQIHNSQHKSTLYILDEPTMGLHFQEVEVLTSILHKIVDNGGSVLVIEHNLTVMAQSDYIVDLGPEAGVHGGEVVGTGSPQSLCGKKTHTGQALKEHFETKSPDKLY